LRFRILELAARWSSPRPRVAADADRAAAGDTAAATAAADPRWPLLRMAIGGLRASAARAGARLLVAQGGTTGPAMTNALRAICDTLHVECVDLTPALACVGPSAHYQYDGHWRAAGHRAAAAVLCPVLRTALEDIVRKSGASTVRASTPVDPHRGDT